ncbi:MAG: response regulator [Thermodesulfovibrionales bacterium]|nr:response regulator [Thermodesulfovibrionales bacterium]
MKKKILIVEDEATLAISLEDMLMESEYNVTGIAVSGEEAIDLFHDKMPDLILMDIKLKGEIDGIEAAISIRSTHSVPIIFLTAFSDDIEVQRAKDIGPEAFILKPFQTRELQIAIEMALYKHEMAMQMEAYRDKLSRLSQQLSDVQDSERESLADYLHDNLVQKLAMLKLALKEEGSTCDTLSFNNSIQMLDEIVHESRALMLDLSPTVLLQLGLMGTIEWLIDQYREKYRLEISFEFDEKADRVNKKYHLEVFKSTRELLTNVVKHAKAKKVQVYIRLTGDSLTIEVRDDGVGTNVESVFTDTGNVMTYGLFNLVERLKRINGTFHMDSNIGRGTNCEINIRMPELGG